MFLSNGQVLSGRFAPQALGETVPTLTNGYFYAEQGLNLENRFATYEALYRGQASVATVVDKIANSAARLSPKVWDLTDPGGRNELPKSPLGALLRDPCSEMSAYNFWRWTFSTYEVYGEAFWRKVRDGDGRVVDLIPMHPARVIAKRDQSGNVKYMFSIGVADAGILELPSEDVVAFLRWNPLNVMRGMSRLEPLAATLRNEDAARRATDAMWTNGARPSMILTTTQSLSDDAVTRLQAKATAAHSGVDNVGKIAVYEEGLEPKIVQLNAEEMQYIESRKLNMTEVCMVFDVPPPVVHILDHATFSNITEQMRSMYRDTMSPRLEDVESVIDKSLTSEFYPDGLHKTQFDMTDVLRGDFESRSTAAQTLRNNGIATGNEAREIMGLTRSSDPNMDLVFANGALIRLGSAVEKVTLTGTAPAGTPVDVDEGAVDRGELVATPVPALPPAKSYRVLIGREGRMKQAGVTVKTWVAACDAHTALDGVSVPVDGFFGNGARVPDGCGCDLSFGQE